MYLSRNIEKIILEASKKFLCLTLYGPRQVGKSTLVENLFSNIQKVTMDDLTLRDYAKRDPKGFLEYYKVPLVIDEIQKAPELLDFIKIKVDEYKKNKVFNDRGNSLLYILTGSNRFELKNAVVESLAGRTCEFDLLSLSFNELRKSNKSSEFNPDLELLREKEIYLNNKVRSRREIFDDIFKGGMPEYVINQLNRDMFFKSYISTYIEKDVRQIISVGKETAFVNFMKYIALRTACQIDYTEISRSVGIDVRTVKNWISILSASGIIKLLQPYASNLSDRIVKTSKLYFLDTGLCAYLCGIPSSLILEQSAFAGAFYETYVVSEIIKSFYNNYKSIDCLYYYRDRDQYEVDLIIDNFDSIYPIEIKKGINPVSSNKKFTVLKKYKKKVNVGLVIDSTDKVFPINHEVYYCPIDLIGL